MFLLAAASVAVPTPGYGDRWNLPVTRTFHSANLRYRLVITPRQIESQLAYFEGRVPAGSVGPSARFGSRHVIGYTTERTFPLLNDVSPVNALLDNRGHYVVTFDNWHSIGLGDDVVVIYRSNGQLIRKYGLEELLTDSDILLLSRTSSSLLWGGPHRIDERAGELVLTIGPPQNGTNEQRRELRIDLSTGERRGTRRDFWPFTVAAAVAADAASVTVPAPAQGERCIAGETFQPNRQPVASTQLLDAASVRPLPDYPAIARAANVTGAVIVEVMVRRGVVICARATSGPALLRRSAETAALGWQFTSLGSSPDNLVSGQIAFAFRKLW